MRRTAILATCLALFMAANREAVAQQAGQKASQLPAAVEPLIRWLPADTESVIVAQCVRLSSQTLDERRRTPSFGESVQTLSGYGYSRCTVFIRDESLRPKQCDGKSALGDSLLRRRPPRYVRHPELLTSAAHTSQLCARRRGGSRRRGC